MGKSTTSGRGGKPFKPEKPYDGFPLFPHASGRWAKKVRQKLHFFGRWANSVAGEMVPVDDTDASAGAAKIEFDRQWPYISKGLTPPAIDASDACTVRDLCNEFYNAKKQKLETGELSQYSFSEYIRTTDVIVAFFGKDRRVDDLRPADFEEFRKSLAKGCGVVTLKSKINRARVVFKFASDRLLIERPVAYGGAFDRPSEKSLRHARNVAGPRLFERAELLAILDALNGKPIAIEGQDEPVKVPKSATMKAMVLLGLNCAFGNTDVSSLPRSAVDLASGWIKFPRPKTGIQRKIPLWPETVEALTQAIAERPAAKDPADDGLCFITSRGTRYVRLQPSGTEGKHVTINSLARRFESVLATLKLDTQKGRGFYTLRHVFETQAGESIDQVATDAIMGHVDESMAAQYRERISDQRLKAVTEHVRKWLWPQGSEAAWIKAEKKQKQTRETRRSLKAPGHPDIDA